MLKDHQSCEFKGIYISYWHIKLNDLDFQKINPRLT